MALPKVLPNVYHWEYLNTRPHAHRTATDFACLMRCWFIAKVFRKSPFIIDSPGKLSATWLVHCGEGLNQSDPRGVMSLKCEIQIYPKTVSCAPSFSGKLLVLTFGNCAHWLLWDYPVEELFLYVYMVCHYTTAHSRVRRSAKLFISWKASPHHLAKLKNLSL